jgi:MFS family permease
MFLSFWHAAPPQARRSLIAAALGWMLDAFDVMLYALVLASLMGALGMDTRTAGLLGSLTLVASAAGGILFGFVADRFGRTRALIASIVIYSVFTFACGLAQSVWQLAVFRLLLGLGMGGEWASGAALVSETWPAEHRGKALGLMQSAWAIGYGLAALVNMLVLPAFGWRAVFFVGILPAFLTLWVRRRVEEPEIWLQARRGAKTGVPSPEHSAGALRHDGAVVVDWPGAGQHGRAAPSPPHRTDAAGHAADSDRPEFRGDLLALTIVLTLMNACTMFAWWGLNLWVPAYLTLPTARGGVGLDPVAMSWLVIAMQVGMWFGYVTFGFVSDAAGRRRTYVAYLVGAAGLVFAYGHTRDWRVLLALGPVVAFFGTGYFSGFGAVTAELYPTRMRATAQGFTYNIGRLASAVAPFLVGSLADTRGFGAAFTVSAAAFLAAAVCWAWIPETAGRALE